MEETSLLSLICVSALLFCSSTQVHLTVSTRRSQLFEEEPVSLTCEDEDKSAAWTLRRRTTEGHVSKCGDGWGREEGPVCVNSMVLEQDSGVYWCEGVGGASSSSITLTVTGGPVVLESPVLPVMEGHDVTLSCQSKTPPPSLTVDFYRDDVIIGSQPTGHMTLQHVSRSDEGLYRCEIRGHGGSPSSWLSVTGHSTTEAPPTSEAPPTPEAPPLHLTNLQLGLRLGYHLIVFSPYIVSTLLMASVYRQKKTGSDPATLSEEGLDAACDVTTEHHF